MCSGTRIGDRRRAFQSAPKAREVLAEEQAEAAAEPQLHLPAEEQA
jgi:hypothetical protein